MPSGIAPGWDQVRVEYGSEQKLLRTPMEVSLMVNVKWKFLKSSGSCGIFNGVLEIDRKWLEVGGSA